MLPTYLFNSIYSVFTMDNCTIKSNVNITTSGSIISSSSSSYT